MKTNSKNIFISEWLSVYKIFSKPLLKCQTDLVTSASICKNRLISMHSKGLKKSPRQTFIVIQAYLFNVMHNNKPMKNHKKLQELFNLPHPSGNKQKKL